MKQRFVVANWKLNQTIAQARAFAATLLASAPMAQANVAVRCIIAPPSTCLHPLAQALLGSPVAVCAQNVYAEAQGAFTGEVSAPLVAEAGARYTLVGHSERRALFAETYEDTARKLDAAAKASLCPILCVGETKQERAEGRTFEVVNQQLQAGCAAYLKDNAGPLMVAYEPVWAIGSGKAPEPGDAQTVHEALRRTLMALSPEKGADVPLLYGGSVTPQNAGPMLAQRHIDGVLVGGASLKAPSLIAILQAAMADPA